MTIEERLKEMMIQKSGSVNKFAHECELSTSTVATMFTRGANKTNINTIVKICKALNISADELSDGRITPLPDLARALHTTPGKLMDTVIEVHDTNSITDGLNAENIARLKSYADYLRASQEDET